MPIESGRWIITHDQYYNLAFLSDANDGTSLLGCLEQDAPGEEWNVKELRNGRYSIVNFGHKMHASAEFHSKKGDHVVGRETDWLWLITEHDSGKYTISTANGKLRWFLEDDWPKTPITLSDAPPSDPRCLWTFQKIARMKAKEEAGEQKITFRSYFNIMSQLSIGHYTIENVLEQRRPIQTSLFWAAEMGHEVITRLILAQEGVDINCKTTDDRSPLFLAAQNGHEAMVRLLLAHEDIDVNSNAYGWTSLHVAAQNGHSEVVRLLLEQDGVDVQTKDSNGWTPLHTAAQKGRDEVVWLLLARKDVDADSLESDGRSPLHIAAQQGHEAVVRLLLAQKNVDVNSRDLDGATPLHAAAYNGADAVIRLLLAQEGVDVNPRLTSGETPLHSASDTGHDETVRLLLEHEGVNVNVMNINGETPLMCAERNGHRAVVRLLR